MPKFRSTEAEERWREGVRRGVERRREAKGKPVTAASPHPGQTATSDCLRETLRLIDGKIAELQALRRDLERSAGLWLER